MLKYDLEFGEVEDDEDEHRVVKKEHVVDAVYDHILKKNYKSRSITSNTTKRRLLAAALKHQKRTARILGKLNVDEANAEKVAEPTVKSQKVVIVKESFENTPTDADDESSSDDEYVINTQNIVAKKTETENAKDNVEIINVAHSPKVKSPKSQLKKHEDTPMSPLKEVKDIVSPKISNSTSSKKSEKVVSVEKEKVEVKSVPAPTKVKDSIPNKKNKTVIVEEEIDIKEVQKSNKNKNKKVVVEESFDEYSDNEDLEDNEEDEGEEFEDEEDEYDETELAEMGSEMIKKYLRLKEAKAKGKLTPEEEAEFDDEEFECLDDDFDFMDFNKPAYEEEDEQDDEGNDPKLNENLKQAYLTSQKNISINAKTKVNLLGKKRNFNNNVNDSNKKNKKQATGALSKNNLKTKVNFRIGLNNFNEYDQNRSIALSTSGKKRSNGNNSTPTNTGLKSALKKK